jgi:HSP20 family molecular chaperone IbpA
MRLLDYGLYQNFKTLGVFGAMYDMQENENELIFTMGVPGLTQENIDIRIRDGRRLVVKSLKSSKYTPEFNYTFVLPCDVVKKETYANIENGVLEVHIQKDEVKEYKIKLR